MPILSPLGLAGLRLPSINGPWPIILPGWMSPAHQEETLHLLQGALSGRFLPRLDLTWEDGLSRAARAGLDWARREQGEGGLLVIVRLEHIQQLAAVQGEPAFLGLHHLVVVVPGPGGGEPIGPLLTVNRAVWGQLETLYDSLARAHPTMAPDLDALGEPVELFLSPSDLVRLVDGFARNQLEGATVEEAARMALHQRVEGSFGERSSEEQQALLALARGEVGEREPEVLASLERQLLLDAGPEGLRLKGWAGLLRAMPVTVARPTRSHDVSIIATPRIGRPARGTDDHARKLIAWVGLSRHEHNTSRLERALLPLCTDPVRQAPLADLSPFSRAAFYVGRAALRSASGEPGAAEDLGGALDAWPDGVRGLGEAEGRSELSSAWAGTFLALDAAQPSREIMTIGLRWLDPAEGRDTSWRQVWAQLWTRSPGDLLAQLGLRWIRSPEARRASDWPEIWSALWSAGRDTEQLREAGRRLLADSDSQKNAVRVWSALRPEDPLSLDDQAFEEGLVRAWLSQTSAEWRLGKLVELTQTPVPPVLWSPYIGRALLDALRALQNRIVTAYNCTFVSSLFFGLILSLGGQRLRLGLDQDSQQELVVILTRQMGDNGLPDLLLHLSIFTDLGPSLQPLVQQYLSLYPNHQKAPRLRELLPASERLPDR